MAADPKVEWLRAKMEHLVLSAAAPNTGVDSFAELLGMFLANVPDFILLVATDGTILSLNRARPGKTVAEVVGHNLFEYFVDDGSGGLRTHFERVIATGETVSHESTALYSDGSAHAFLTRISPIFSNGRVVAVAVIGTEVSAQKQAEAALRESEEKLRVAVAATGMGLWSWDIKRDVVVWDDTTCRIFGVTHETAPRTREAYQERLHPEDRERMLGVISSVLTRGEYPALEHRIVRPDGIVRRVMAKGSVTRAPDGSIEKLIGGVLDVTEQREAEDRARQNQKLEAVGQLSAGVAHNFNNMLMAILPNIELALETALPETVPVLESARDAGLRAAELVRQLMTFAGRSRSREKRADDVRPLVERTVAICRRAFDPGIELSLHCPDQAEPVLADATQLEQVLLNLLINARDAVTDASVGTKRVRVEVERVTAELSESASLGLETGRAYVCVRVIDNGVGMDSAVSSRMYEPFFTTKEVGKGTGLGLSTARAIVWEHGGALDCSTSRTRGTTLSMYLPLAAALSQPVIVSAPLLEPSGSQTIMVVDDDAPVREVVRKMLERAGYTVSVAASGRAALELLSKGSQPALVLLDLSMPGMSGEAVRSELRKIAPNLKVAYLSGHALDASDDIAGVIQKPATYAALVQGVREILQRS